MIDRLLLAVDDSPAALVAARTVVDLAVRLRARVRAVNVVRDGVVTEAVSAAIPAADVALRRSVGAASLLGYVAREARRAGVEIETVQLEGEPARCILSEAVRWPADLIVIVRSGRPDTGEPYVGSETAGVLEVAEQPVLVVPPIGGRGRTFAPAAHATAMARQGATASTEEE